MVWKIINEPVHNILQTSVCFCVDSYLCSRVKILRYLLIGLVMMAKCHTFLIVSPHLACWKDEVPSHQKQCEDNQ